MTVKVEWPDIHFGPCNLYTMPKTKQMTSVEQWFEFIKQAIQDGQEYPGYFLWCHLQNFGEKYERTL